MKKGKRPLPGPEERTNELPESDPMFVVAIDFGTTFSKAAYALSPDKEPAGFLELDKVVHLITDWPYQEAGAGSKHCKTKTCLWYMPGAAPGTFELRAWGWEGFVKYKKHVEELLSVAESTISVRQQETLWKNQGHLITNFKLWVADDKMVNLPKGLTMQRVLTDFLNRISTYIISELRSKHGKKVSKRHVKWCITVPAIWDEWPKQRLEDCAEMAGLVQGPFCRDQNASAHDLIIVIEPEAASIYCHNILRTLSNGDTFLVADLGGGTADLVTHRKVGSTTRSNVRVKEVAKSIGGLYGGVHVDESFLRHLRKVIGNDCFEEFEAKYPALVLEILISWGRIKSSFAGACECWTLFLPTRLAEAWKKHSSADNLDSPKRTLTVNAKEILGFSQIDLKSRKVKEIFDNEVDPIIKLIERHDLSKVDNILIVGGFSESAYVRRRITETFSRKSGRSTPSIVFPRNPDTAVVRGAVALGVRGEWESFVSSRIAKKTYGFDTSVPFNLEEHPVQFLVHDGKQKVCDNIFHTIIRRGDEVPFNLKLEFVTYPLYRKGYDDDDNIDINLYSTYEKNPKYVLGDDVTHEATCVIPVPCKSRMTKQPRLELSVYFGGTRIRVAVRGMNFNGETIAMPPVKFRCVNQNHHDYDEAVRTRLADVREYGFRHGTRSRDTVESSKHATSSSGNPGECSDYFGDEGECSYRYPDDTAPQNRDADAYND